VTLIILVVIHVKYENASKMRFYVEYLSSILNEYLEKRYNLQTGVFALCYQNYVTVDQAK